MIYDISFSMMCACAESAKASGATHFGTHFWGECWAITNVADLEEGGDSCYLADGLYQTKCSGNKNAKFGCLGDDESYFVYKL